MGTQNASQINDLRFKAENEDEVVLECEALLMFDSPFSGNATSCIPMAAPMRTGSRTYMHPPTTRIR